jgi:hypothetical protein
MSKKLLVSGLLVLFVVVIVLAALHTLLSTPASTRSIIGIPKVSANGHNLERSDGTPFVLLSDTEWLLDRFSDSAVLTILDDRAAKGFTAVQVFATRSWGGNEMDSKGNYPFKNNDCTSLVPAYWNHWRWIADQAASRGLYFILVMGEPTRLGDEKIVWKASSTAAAYSYGRQVAGYFASSPNIIFAIGMDDKASDYTDYKRATAEGVADGVNGVNNFDGNANYSDNIMTYHGYNVSSSLHNDAWIDFYGPEVWHRPIGVYPQVTGDYNLSSPTKPSFLMEGWYEAEEGQTAWGVRNEAWTSFLAGITGYGYGHYDNWTQISSMAYLNAPGAAGVGQIMQFANQHNWWKWVPDYSLGQMGVKAYDGSEIVVYYTGTSAATINNSLLSAANATWYDPRNANTTSSGGTFNAGQSRIMTPPSGWEGALLVIKADAR